MIRTTGTSRAIGVAVTLAGLFGCSDPSGTVSSSHVGEYELVVANGSGLPALVRSGSEEGIAIQVGSGRLELAANGDASLDLMFALYDSGTGAFLGDRTESEIGDYGRSDAAVQLQWSGGAEQSAVYDDARDEITLAAGGDVYAFRKR